MRRLAAFRVGVARLLAVALLGLVATALLFAASGPAARSLESSGSFRILYVSDWSGTSELYAVDSSGERVTAQLTFGRAPTCAQAACGYSDAVPSPDGRFILYTDFADCSFAARRSAVFVARADGTHRRVLARTDSPSGCPRALDGVWAPDSKRIAYVLDGRIHVVDLDGGQNRVVARGDRAGWSPDGTSLAFLKFDPSSVDGQLSVRRNGHTRIVAALASEFAWSPNGRWLAYSTHVSGGQDGLAVVRPDGSDRRVVLSAGYLRGLEWSADSRFLGTDGEIVNVASGSSRRLGNGVLAWQPHGHLLASSGADGTFAIDAATGATRRLTPDQAVIGRWSPDGRFLAYLTQLSFPYVYANSDLRVVTLAGRTRTLVSAAGSYGGSLSELAWARVPNGVHYRRAQARVLAAVRDDGLTARWPITRLAADGKRVAYVSCGHVFVWTPSSRTVVQAEPDSSLSPRCTTPGYYLPFGLYTLALSGDRIAFGYLRGNAGQSWGLYAGRVGDAASFVSLARVGSANACAVGDGGLGDLSGAGGLLVFSTWRDRSISAACPVPTLEQEIHRVEAAGCPCPVIATSPGPLVPFDVEAGRVVAGGENATVVYDAGGTQLLSVPVSPLAAQLSGSDLVVLVRGQLLVYDAITGARLHAWPLPDVPSGGECASPHSGTWECRDARLVLEDAARGLAAYILDGQVHVLRLADGADKLVGAASLARFVDAGLVYADGLRLRLVPFDRLPLR
jgi:Tol biopolymer transport system component